MENSIQFTNQIHPREMSQRDLKNPVKVKRSRNGRIFIFTDRSSRDQMVKAKEILTELSYEDSIAEIRIDGKVPTLIDSP